MQPCHGAPPHQSAAGSSPFWVYSGPPCAAAQPCHVQVPAQFMGTAYGQPFTGSFWHTAAPWQPWTTPPQFQGCSGCRPTAEPEQSLRDKDGTLKPFSSVSQISGRSYEGMLSSIFDSGGPRTLCAVQHQDAQERERLEKSRTAVASFLQENVSDHAWKAMTEKGVAEEQAEVDTVYNGSFKAFAESIKKLSEVTVSATCAEVQKVLVQCCSDCRFLAMKLYQIELQSCLVARQGYLLEDLPRQQLTAQTTGFAIIFNRAALQIDTEKLVIQFDLRNVRQLLQEEKLHIAYFQSEAALPAAVSMARDADQRVKELEEKLSQGLVGTTAALTKTVWVRQLQKDGAGRLELTGNAFPIDPLPRSIAYLKKAIEREEKLTIPASRIDIYLQEDGGWTMQTRMDASLRDTDEDNPYGYFSP